MAVRLAQALHSVLIQLNMTTDQQLHLASQFLAMAGKNYMPAKEDDSHTNVGWRKDKSSFVSRRLNKDSFLELDTIAFKLDWKGKQFFLAGKKKHEVLDWLNFCAESFGYEPFKFEPHYDIPFVDLKGDFEFSAINPERAKELAELRTKALTACIQSMKLVGLNAEIRVWPHHFDTGGYVQLDDIGIGFGMAIPDENIDSYYYYVAGYKGHEPIPVDDLPSLNTGEWFKDGFTGALLRTGNVNTQKVVSFYRVAMKIYQQLK